MDPFLEAESIWSDVHNSLIASIRDALAPALRPRYVVRIEERTYLSESEGLAFVGTPDLKVARTNRNAPEVSAREGESAEHGAVLTVEVPSPHDISETYLEVRTPQSGDVITVLEILSPSNKIPGEGRSLYEKKRLSVLATRTNLMEIDLIRAGEPMRMFGTYGRSDYRTLISRGDRRPTAELRLFSIRDAIPAFPVPLQPGDDEPCLDPGELLAALYDRAAYDLPIDYSQDPPPPLTDADRAFIGEVLRPSGQR